MTATNHALTGALIGVAVSNPWLAIPLAVASHFVCDAIPHFGLNDQKAVSRPAFARFLTGDIILAVLLLAGSVIARPNHWLLLVICGISAMSPDLMWIPTFIRARRGQQFRKRRGIMRFHEIIQWFERPRGLIVEVAWLFVGITVLFNFLG